MDEIYDVIGIGFGPSNLALAFVIDEQCAHNGLKATFLEQKTAFAWHPHMLLPGSEMQISFLKDLATLRNPSSPYTFLNYLKSVGRLAMFANLRHFYPSRIEFNAYLAWVAGKLAHYVQFGRCVESVLPCGGEPATLLEVVCRNLGDGTVERFFTRNIVVAPGGTPVTPFAVAVEGGSERVWHSARYMEQIASYRTGARQPLRFAVVGSGQSAAEIVLDLHSSFPHAEVYNIYRGFGLKPADDSEFVNELFDGKFIDLVHTMPPEAQRGLLAAHADTNYSVVDAQLISQLYKIHYQEKVSGKPRLHVRNLSTVTGITETDQQVCIATTAASGAHETLVVDAAILATGYRYANPPRVLDGLKEYLTMNAANDSATVIRHYKVATDRRLGAGIYVQGCNESTHGLSDTLLSNLPFRAEEILQQMMASHGAHHGVQTPA